MITAFAWRQYRLARHIINHFCTKERRPGREETARSRTRDNAKRRTHLGKTAVNLSTGEQGVADFDAQVWTQCSAACAGSGAAQSGTLGSCAILCAASVQTPRRFPQRRAFRPGTALEVVAICPRAFQQSAASSPSSAFKVYNISLTNACTWALLLVF